MSTFLRRILDALMGYIVHVKVDHVRVWGSSAFIHSWGERKIPIILGKDSVSVNFHGRFTVVKYGRFMVVKESEGLLEGRFGLLSNPVLVEKC